MKHLELSSNAKSDADILAVVENLCRIQVYDKDHFISLPVIFPTGSSGTVRVRRTKFGFQVSDAGSAFLEADAIGLSRSFRMLAKKHAAKHFVIYSEGAFEIELTAAEQLAAGISAVSGAAVETLAHSLENMKDAAISEMGDLLFERLLDFFSEESVKRDGKQRGASGHEWEFESTVSLDSQVILFETVTPFANSVTSATAKFFDVARLRKPPERISVIKSYEGFGDLANVLQQASTVVELDRADKSFLKSIVLSQ